MRPNVMSYVHCYSCYVYGTALLYNIVIWLSTMHGMNYIYIITCLVWPWLNGIGVADLEVRRQEFKTLIFTCLDWCGVFLHFFLFSFPSYFFFFIIFFSSSSFSKTTVHCVPLPSNTIFLHYRRSLTIAGLFYTHLLFKSFSNSSLSFTLSSSFSCSFHCSCCNLFWRSLVLHSVSITIPS